MKTKICLFLLLTTAALLLTSCRIAVDTEIRADGAGDLRTAVVYTAEEKNNFAQKPENASKSICDNIKKDVPADAKFVEEIQNGETFCITERSFNNLAELRKLYTGMAQVTVNQLEFQLGKFTLDIDVDLTNNKEGEGLVHEWRLTLPGEIGAQNADRVEGQTLIWVISPGEKDNLHAESQVGLNPASLGIAGAVIFALVIAGIITAFLLRYRRK